MSHTRTRSILVGLRRSGPPEIWRTKAKTFRKNFVRGVLTTSPWTYPFWLFGVGSFRRMRP